MCTWIYFTYIYIHTVHIHTHARTHTHTHGWCRPLQSHGAINSQIYKINRFSSNRSLLDVEVTHENKTDQNPDPAEWTWAPPCSQQRAGGSSGPAPASCEPLRGGDSHPQRPFLLSLDAVTFSKRSRASCYKHLGSARERRCWMQGEISLPSFANADPKEATPREGGGGGHQIKAAFSNTGWSTKRFLLSKRARLTFFSLASEAHITFFKGKL